MPVLRIHKTKNYTVMSNYHLREKSNQLSKKNVKKEIFKWKTIH